ncbi:hypothetical protein Rsub_09795 [Raphidocelis subcapitata]|uniref:Uncharacterized protein n=1 Tax=Raphidocelis subcapitata TaxID=307507 RepID=A0A2V0PAW3_9CHLO|nr:hypothetical protein Rsub_09795 [Raphidocelis subcapitata]|eukprot:GBF96998.1 hypothetical protein Rsub_09795 [Raphidocelis subcapitata]
MPIGGKLVLKGGETLGGVKKKKKKHKKKPEDEAAAAAAAAAAQGEQAGGSEQQQQEQQPAGGAAVPKAGASGITTKGNTYEQEFSLEMERTKQGKVRSTAWGSSYRAPPEVLHGYTKKINLKTANASERLDLRAAAKHDKFCK